MGSSCSQLCSSLQLLPTSPWTGLRNKEQERHPGDSGVTEVWNGFPGHWEFSVLITVQKQLFQWVRKREH